MNLNNHHRRIHIVICLVLMFAFTSCSSLITSTLIEPTVDNLQQQTDLELVCDGAPAYLLMIDSMIASNPASPGLLKAGSQAYSGYVAAMSECDYPASRIKTVSEKSREYGKRLLGSIITLPPTIKREQFEQELAMLGHSDVSALFWGSLAWLNWIQHQAGAPLAMADLATVEKLMYRLLELDEAYQGGAAHLFFGGYYATKPPMFGGDPVKSRFHFEKALHYSERNFLLIQTTFAETLARQTWDRELHDKLLLEVIEYPLERAPQFTLSNQIAKRKARRLLDENYFAE